MKKKLIISSLLFFAVVVSALGFYFQNKESKEAEHVHLHAGFQVYIDGVKQNYTDFEFMSMSPCSTEPKELTPEEKQMEKAHLHDQVGDVVHVHTKGATWGDLFDNLNVTFDKNKEIQAYNEPFDSTQGELVTINNVLDKEINPYESIIIVVGDQSKVEEYKQNFVSRGRIEETEKRSELCGATKN